MKSWTFKSVMQITYKSVNNPRYSTETERSKHVWKLENKERDFVIKWSVLKHVTPRTAGRRACNYVLEEKLCIF